MHKSKLDWINFDWGYFQTLCTQIANDIYPEYNFDEYLKPGQKQDGIDIIGFNKKANNFFTIQCKREKKITEGDLTTIIKEFREGEYYDKSSHFVLATSFDLQSQKLQIKINAYRVELYDEKSIEFVCWDKHVIEGKLVNRWDLVLKYFGLEQAKDFCFEQLKYENFPELNRIENYIPRQITLLEKNRNEQKTGWNFTQKKLFDLKEIFLEDRLKTIRICIIGDAYQGKSFYLKQKAYELKESGQNIQPLFIEIKDNNVQPLETLLENRYGAWQKIPAKDLVLFIDGLDETPTDKFVEMIKFINEFSLSYNPVNIIFSCRTLFYNNYTVESKLSNFETFELYPLQEEGIDWYINTMLKSQASYFNIEVNLAEIWPLLHHPFYLIHIVQGYLQPPHKLPGSKIKVLEGLIKKSFAASLDRPLRDGDSINEQSDSFQITIEKFAFALQLAGVNSFNNSEIQQLFDYNEKLLLKHSSLVIHSGENWSFTNALFQEHIAASLLAKVEFEKLVSFCTIGTTFKKIKPKWIQTISSLLSILEINDILFNKIIKLIEDDNIELIFLTESSKFTNAQKLHFLKNLIEKCVTQNIRPLLVYEDKISFFIQASNSSIDYLLNTIKKIDVSERVKIVCCKILRNASINDSQKEIYIDLMEIELTNTKDAYYAGNLIQVLTDNNIGNNKLIRQLISNEFFRIYHEYRDKLYELILKLGFIDDFYSYGLEGLPFLIKHNENISHGGSEYYLQEFLLGGKKIQNLCSLLRVLKQDGWADYFERHGKYKKDFIQALFDKLADAFDDYPFMIFQIAAFIKDLGMRGLRTEFKQIDKFLEKTNSYWLIVRILIDDIFKDNSWELSTLITFESYDYIFFEFEEENYEMQKLLNCLSGIRYKNANELPNTFYKLCIDLTEKRIINNQEASRHELYIELEKKRHENDLIYIQSITAFKKGIENYFTAYGKKSIPEDDLYVDVDGHRHEIRKNADSSFIYKYLLNWNNDSSLIRMGDCLKKLNKNLFEIFRADEILDYSSRDESFEKLLLPLLKDFYYENLSTANFKNCLSKEDCYNYLNQEFRLGEIFKKFKFQTPENYLIEFIWLDSGGTRSFKTASLNKTESISKMVLEQLSATGLITLKKKIVENIKQGIISEQVLGSHIGLCKHLKIIEAKDTILKCINELSDGYVSKSDSVDIYLELGGDINEVLKYYKTVEDYNSYIFFYLTTILYKVYPDEIKIIGIEVLSSSNIEYNRKIAVAQILAEIGEFNAFAFLVNEVRVYLKSPHHIQNGHSIAKVDTGKALKELEDIVYMMIDSRYNDRKTFRDSAQSIILEWVNTLALKSEEDLERVINFYEDAKIKLKEYDNASDFNWYINRAFENFRDSGNTVESIVSIKNIIASL